MRFSALLPAISLTLMCVWPVTTKALDFFHTRGGHSLTALFGLPTPVPGQQTQFLLTGGHASQFAGGQTGQGGSGEVLFLDGERSEVRLSWFHAVNPCIQYGVELPLIAHIDGYFDNAIEQWHSIFGLPNANRGELEQDNLSIEYRDPEGRSLSLNSSSAGPGDLQLQIVRALSCERFRSRSLPDGAIDQTERKSGSVFRMGIKLPTGDKTQLQGSGAADIFIDLNSATWPLGKRWSVKGSVGLLWAGRSKLFSNQRSVVAFGNAAMGWRYSSRLSLKTQIGWHTPFFDSELRELGQFSAQLGFGGSWVVNSRNIIEIAIQEDITPDTSPDIILHLGYRRTVR